MSTKTAAPGGNKMGTWPIGKLLVNMALPLVISMLVQALYNVVDSIYVSRISESAVTALSLAFPIQNLLIGCATGVGVGVNSLLSKSLGEQNYERANRTAGNGFLLSCLFSIGFVIFGLFFARPFFATQTTVAETLDGGSMYLAIVTIGSIGFPVRCRYRSEAWQRWDKAYNRSKMPRIRYRTSAPRSVPSYRLRAHRRPDPQ